MAHLIQGSRGSSPTYSRTNLRRLLQQRERYNALKRGFLTKKIENSLAPNSLLFLVPKLVDTRVIEQLLARLQLHGLSIDQMKRALILPAACRYGGLRCAHRGPYGPSMMHVASSFCTSSCWDPVGCLKVGVRNRPTSAHEMTRMKWTGTYLVLSKL